LIECTTDSGYSQVVNLIITVEQPNGRKIVEYLTASNFSSFDRLLKKALDAKAPGFIRVRLTRIEQQGNFGDCGSVGDA
jgi:hypothetical protein